MLKHSLLYISFYSNSFFANQDFHPLTLLSYLSYNHMTHKVRKIVEEWKMYFRFMYAYRMRMKNNGKFWSIENASNYKTNNTDF